MSVLAESCMIQKPLPDIYTVERELPRSPGLCVQVSGYLQALLASIDGPVVLEAAAGILALAKVADRVLAAAPVLAIGAFMDLWDHDSSSVSHAQIMEVVCANLDALQVMTHAAQHPRSDDMPLQLAQQHGPQVNVHMWHVHVHPLFCLTSSWHINASLEHVSLCDCA